MNIHHTYSRNLAQKKTFLCAHIPASSTESSRSITQSPHPTPHYTRIRGIKHRGCNATYPWYCCVHISKIFICLSKVGFTSCMGYVGATPGYHNTAASCRLVFVWIIVFACLILWGLVDFRDDNSFESTCGKCIRSVQICTYARDR